MANKLNLTVPDIGAPDATRLDGYLLDEDVGVPGSPILEAIGNDQYYFFSKMMLEADIAFTGVTDNSDVNQFFEALEKIAKIPLEVTIESGDTITIDKRRYYSILLDSTLGAFSKALPDGIYVGQRVKLKNISTGTGNITVTGTNLYTNGVVFSPGKSLWVEWNGTGWDCEDVVTADYVGISGEKVFMKSKGGLELNNIVNVVFASTNRLDSVWVFSVLFLIAPYVYVSFESDTLISLSQPQDSSPKFALNSNNSVRIDLRKVSGAVNYAAGDNADIHSNAKGNY